MSNIEEFKKIPNVIPGSQLNQIIERPAPKISPYNPANFKVENNLKEPDLEKKNLSKQLMFLIRINHLNCCIKQQVPLIPVK